MGKDYLSSAKETIKRIDIVKVLKTYPTIQLHKNKKGYTWRGFCPFHQDTEFAFRVYQEEGTIPHYYCLLCKTRGDVVNFIQKIDDVDFKTAFRKALTLSGLQ